jgi:hypothetical protein
VVKLPAVLREEPSMGSPSVPVKRRRSAKLESHLLAALRLLGRTLYRLLRVLDAAE